MNGTGHSGWGWRDVGGRTEVGRVWRGLTLAMVAGVAAIIGLVVGPAPSVLAATTFTVSSTGDEPDATVDSTCATSLGTCTLRAAIKAAQDTVGDDVIEFHIPGSGLRTITIGSNLPAINDGLTINGWSQGVFDGIPDYAGPPLIAINSANPVAASQRGLRISGSTVHIVGLSIGGFTRGIDIVGGDSHTIVGSYLGVVPAAVPNGTDLAPNQIGISVKTTSAVTIGGTGNGEGNVIAGNTETGVDVQAAGIPDPINFLGNFIGIDRRGTVAIPNGRGVTVNPGFVTIGDGTPGGRNVIAGNTGDGLRIRSGSAGIVKGNYIGVGADGSTGVANNIGVNVDNVKYIEIGGPTVGERNVISGNTTTQVDLAGLCGCSVLLVGNYIGPNADGTGAPTNTANGVRLTDASEVTIGGLFPGERNLISGNGKDGIRVIGDTSEKIQIGGNWIGLNAAGTAALPNGGNGISLVPGAASPDGPFRTRIGDETPGTSNVISGNLGHGIRILRTRQDTSIVHNLIGTDPTGGIAIPNGGDGILIERANRLTVRENTIANNGKTGVVMMPRSGGAFGNVLFGNSIYENGGLGIDLTDTLNPDDTGDGNIPTDPSYPVVTTATTSAAGTVIGGTLAGDKNLPYRVELFASPSCDPSGNGEGRAFIGGVDVGTNGSGTASFAVTVPALPPGQVVTATATNLDHQTSEFSLCKEVTTAAILVSPTSGLTTTEAGGKATFTVALSTVPTGNVVIGLSSSKTTEGTVSPSTLTFTPSNATTPQTVTITGVPDSTADGNQTYAIVTAAATSSDPAYNGMNAPDVSVVNQDSGNLPTVSIASAEVTEGTGASVPMSFPVTMSPASTQPVTVSWIVQSGTAQVGNDIVEETGSLTFAPGETSKAIVVSIVGDSLGEGTETFTMRLGQVANAAIGVQTATGTIKDDDLPASACSPNRPKISVNVQKSGTEQMLVSITAGTGTLQKVSFGIPGRPMQNATVLLIGSSSVVSNESSFTPAPGTTQMTFQIKRVNPGQAVTIPLVVEDGCGPWETFVGGGTSAF